MAPRLNLHSVLLALMPDAHKNVYFQEPPNTGMQYPCIVYHVDSMDADHADNAPYRIGVRYEVTVMDRNPDSEIPMKVAKLPTASHNRSYTVSNLNHSVFTLFF